MAAPLDMIILALVQRNAAVKPFDPIDLVLSMFAHMPNSLRVIIISENRISII